MKDRAPIGIFDSGIGGITVLQELQKELPFEQFIYLSDDKFHPYGEKQPLFLQQIVKNNLLFLKDKGVKLIVIACHTASLLARGTFESSLEIPIIDMISPTLSSVLPLQPENLSIIGTQFTTASHIYPDLIHETLPSCQIQSIATPKLVEQIEKKAGLKQLMVTIAASLSDLPNRKGQYLLLACTHFPLIKEKIREIFDKVDIIDPSMEVAKLVRKSLPWRHPIQTKKKPIYYSTKNPSYPLSSVTTLSLS